MMPNILYKKKVFIFYFLLTVFIYAGEQTVDISLDLTYPGSGQTSLGKSHIVDLGFLNDGAYSGGNRIEVGILKVQVSQKKSSEGENACALNSIELDSVNLKRLADPLYRPAIEIKKTSYTGSSHDNGVRMYTEVIGSSIIAQGDIDGSSDVVFFVDPSCNEDFMKGAAIHRLSYEMKLYVEIDRVAKGDVAAINGNGTTTSIRDIVYSQIRGTTVRGGKR